MKTLSLLVIALLAGSEAFAGGQAGGGGAGGGTSAHKLWSNFAMESSQLVQEKLVARDDFESIVSKALANESVVIDHLEFVGVGIDLNRQTVELQPTDSTSANLLVSPIEADPAVRCETSCP